MRGRQALVGSVGLLLALAAISAQQKPSFTGRWVLVSPAEGAGQEHTITQDAATLTTGHVSEGGGHGMVYKLDGTESRNVLVSHGSDIVTVSKASWNGNQLTITSETTYPDNRKRHVNEVWSLGGDGRLVVEFTETWLGASPRTTKLVYAKR
jgi:hypothetical protein